MCACAGGASTRPRRRLRPPEVRPRSGERWPPPTSARGSAAATHATHAAAGCPSRRRNEGRCLEELRVSAAACRAAVLRHEERGPRNEVNPVSGRRPDGSAGDCRMRWPCTRRGSPPQPNREERGRSARRGLLCARRRGVTKQAAWTCGVERTSRRQLTAPHRNAASGTARQGPPGDEQFAGPNPSRRARRTMRRHGGERTAGASSPAHSSSRGCRRILR
jgi:hypothetical protein